MKKILQLLSILFVAFYAFYCYAGQRTESFSWEYSIEDEANIDGFRIYQDGGAFDNIVWEGGPAERSATIIFDDLKSSHSFSCTAWKLQEDSTILDSDHSDFAVWILPKEKPKNVGNFINN